jgi:formiminotetrahydrofolate cyclodeaminase
MAYLGGSIKAYLDDLASRKPTPGGGSAAALVSATGVGLMEMVANFTIGKEKYKVVEEEMKNVLSSSMAIRQRLSELVDEDTRVYSKVSSAYKLPKDTQEERCKREEAIQDALKVALGVPFDICRLSYEAMKMCPRLCEKGNEGLISDVGVAVLFLEAGFHSGMLNVQINLNGIKDRVFVEETMGRLKPMIGGVDDTCRQVLNSVKRKMGGADV